MRGVGEVGSAESSTCRMQREHRRSIHARISLYTTRAGLAAIHILFCDNNAPNRRQQVLVLHARLDRPWLSEWNLTSTKGLHELRAECVYITTHVLTTLRTSFTPRRGLPQTQCPFADQTAWNRCSADADRPDR
jgi:hypothetical protein